MNFSPQYWFTLFCHEAIIVANLRTFPAYNLKFKKLRWRTKIDKLQVWGELGWAERLPKRFSYTIQKSWHHLWTAPQYGWQFLTQSGVDRRELKIWAGRRSIARQILPAPNNISTAHNWFPDLSDRQLWRVGFLDAILIKATMHCIALHCNERTFLVLGHRTAI